ncbi:MAG TPA: polyphosphate kinase 2, partial [Gammaproteobacteria bacterium]|nr:polyphosphate kinase 2 [Gammaproteobacteria bacterium]
MSGKGNSEFVKIKGRQVDLPSLLARIEGLERENALLKKQRGRALRRYRKQEELKPYEAELIKLQEQLEADNRRMIILFEGRDAAGKGGAIQRITFYMNPRHYRVIALGKPTREQRGQWYFQKYVTQFPRGGEIAIFDRSWYNRALVEPVFEFCSEKEHLDFMQGVAGFERDLVRQGTILVKLYFSVSKKVQAQRFEVRKTNPLKQWKLSEIDLQVQERWDDFSRMKYEMLKRTHTQATPWTIIRADDKHRARLNAIKVILSCVDYQQRNKGLDYALDPNVVYSGSEEL